MLLLLCVSSSANLRARGGGVGVRTNGWGEAWLPICAHIGPPIGNSKVHCMFMLHKDGRQPSSCSYSEGFFFNGCVRNSLRCVLCMAWWCVFLKV